MKSRTPQKFGGNWTEQKLEMIRKYLGAYAKIMSKQKFEFAYVDAFAGTGYRELKKNVSESLEFSFSDSIDKESQEFLDGSAKIALSIEPKFNRYIFIEKDLNRFKELERLKTNHNDLAECINLVNEDANDFLQSFCKANWKKHRAVVFLDPFGMQVTWDTISLIAKTKAIDLWILFPLGSGVSRLLKRDGKISKNLKEKLSQMFGEDAWYDEFYKPSRQMSLIDETPLEKVASFDSIAAYFVSRLETIFPHVHQNPLPLLNSKNNPLFLLCFAAGAKKGGDTAVKIANDILRR